ncbi:hypothetical protein, partial [Escherichia coli]|uniref:hypothetical protein n=1 Tax=Escherichia coli TaxID=562 RepID=UPI003904D9FF
MKLSGELNRPGNPGECFICELRLPAHHFRWKHNTLFLPLTEGCGPALPVSIDCYTLSLIQISKPPSRGESS